MAEPWLKAAVALEVELPVAFLVSAGVNIHFTLVLVRSTAPRPPKHQPTRCF